MKVLGFGWGRREASSWQERKESWSSKKEAALGHLGKQIAAYGQHLAFWGPRTELVSWACMPTPFPISSLENSHLASWENSVNNKYFSHAFHVTGSMLGTGNRVGNSQKAWPQPSWNSKEMNINQNNHANESIITKKYQEGKGISSSQSVTKYQTRLPEKVILN